MKSITMLLSLASLGFFLCSCNNSTDEPGIITTPENFVFNQETRGCSDFTVYEINDLFHTIHVSGQRDSLEIGTTSKSFELPHDHINIAINQFDGFIGNYYCDDVLGDEGTILNIYEPISGSVDIVITQDSLVINDWEVLYEISVTLNDLIFEVDGTEVFIENKVFDPTTVGWFPG